MTASTVRQMIVVPILVRALLSLLVPACTSEEH